ncbi:MAG: hypothetical protein P8J50_09340 [Acidimicrobiales bacterium]|nr:hypothetical protein [Acidimicrobiales bacterium]
MNADSARDPVRLTPNDALAGLAAWLTEGRVDAAAAERARQRWLERHAAEDATVIGVLRDLAERGRPVSVRTRGGRNAHGRVAALGADFVVIREERLGDVLVPTSAVATVRPALGDPTSVGDRPAALAIVAGEELRGDLRSAGRDVLTVEVEADDRRDVVSVAVAAIDHLVILRR